MRKSLHSKEQLQDDRLLESRAYVAGEWIQTAIQAEVRDPATQRLITTVAQCAPGMIAGVIDCAVKAQKAWAAQLPLERGRVLRAWADLVRLHARDLAVIVVMEQGKPLREALGEVEYAASYLEWFAAEGERAYAQVPPSHRPGAQIATTLQPVGVVCAITPWNFPCAMIARKAGAALAAGCSVVVKPAPETPLSALALARLGASAGIPAGVLQVVLGEAKQLAEPLLSSANVRAISFTGSTATGRVLLAKSAPTIKRPSMELGGNAPFIAFPDAPLDAVVSAAITAKFTTAGQDCLAANRMFIARPIYEAFVEALGDRVSRLVVGHGLDNGVDVGPLTQLSGARRCRSRIREAQRVGCRIIAGGAIDDDHTNFVTPTVIADATDDMEIAREEVFGPIATVLPFDEEAEVIARANATEMGLAAYVFTQNVGRAMRVSRQLEYGMVAVNTASFTGPPVPFGGWKQSGLGREGGLEGIREFMEIKYVCYGNVE